jgi:hypothetical protein
MQIACLGWGSLVWDTRSLPIRGIWFCDGPLLPIEFARQSSGDRITLVIASIPERVRALWALLASPNLNSARKDLADREGVSKDIERDIAFWTSRQNSGHSEADVIGEWASRTRLDGVVWTALEPGLSKKRGSVPTEAEVLRFLRNLPRNRQRATEEYLRNAPPQIDTRYRRRIEKEFGWSPSVLAFSACGLTRRCT